MESNGRRSGGTQKPKTVMVPIPKAKGGRNFGHKKKANAEVQKLDAEVQTDNDILELSMELAKGNANNADGNKIKRHAIQATEIQKLRKENANLKETIEKFNKLIENQRDNSTTERYHTNDDLRAFGLKLQEMSSDFEGTLGKQKDKYEKEILRKHKVLNLTKQKRKAEKEEVYEHWQNVVKAFEAKTRLLDLSRKQEFHSIDEAKEIKEQMKMLEDDLKKEKAKSAIIQKGGCQAEAVGKNRKRPSTIIIANSQSMDTAVNKMPKIVPKEKVQTQTQPFYIDVDLDEAEGTIEEEEINVDEAEGTLEEGEITSSSDDEEEITCLGTQLKIHRPIDYKPDPVHQSPSPCLTPNHTPSYMHMQSCSNSQPMPWHAETQMMAMSSRNIQSKPFCR